MTGTVTTWLDGRVQTVPADDARLAEQEEQRVRLLHVANMRRLPLHGHLASAGHSRRFDATGVDRETMQRGSLTPTFAISRPRKRVGCMALLGGG